MWLFTILTIMNHWLALSTTTLILRTRAVAMAAPSDKGDVICHGFPHQGAESEDIHTLLVWDLRGPMSGFTGTWYTWEIRRKMHMKDYERGNETWFSWVYQSMKMNGESIWNKNKVSVLDSPHPSSAHLWNCENIWVLSGFQSASCGTDGMPMLR